MSGYIGVTPVPQTTQTRDSFTATAGQTSFGTSGYQENYLDVYLNGVKLAAADYTATNGSDVVLGAGAAVNDILEVVAFGTFEVANQAFTGTTTINTLTVTNDGAGSNLDADQLDGQHGAYYAVAASTTSALDLKAPLASPTLTGNPVAPTQTAGNNSTRIATTAYADTAITNLVDSSPAALNTLNELAAALGDDANFSTTVTNSIATKLPLSGGTLTGDLTLDSSTHAFLKLDKGASGDYALTRYYTAGTEGWRTGTYNDGTSYVIGTPTDKRLSITTDGNVGIGCTPASTVSLDVQNLSASSNNVFLRIKNATNLEDAGLIIEGQNGGAREYKIGVNSIANTPDLTFSGPTGYRYYIGGSEAMRITSAGNTTINGKFTLTPTGYVGGIQNLASINISSSGGGETRAIDIDGSWTSGESKSINWIHGSDSTNFLGSISCSFDGTGGALNFGKLYHSGDSSTYTMSLNSTSLTTANLTVAGNVLVGTTSAAQFNTSTETGSQVADGYIAVARPETVAYFNRLSTDGDIVSFRKNGSPVGSIAMEGSGPQLTVISTAEIRLKSPNTTTDVWVRGEVKPWAGGQSDLGDSIYNWKDLHLSGGVVFGPASASNVSSQTLDDYEEGTWSPTAMAGSVTATASSYTKIGRLVQLTTRLSSFSDTGGSHMHIKDLPFTLGADNTNVGFGWGNFSLKTVYAYGIINQAKIALYSGGSSPSAYAPTLHSDIGSGEIILKLEYFTNQ
jgi:hypothetical protein